MARRSGRPAPVAMAWSAHGDIRARAITEVIDMTWTDQHARTELVRTVLDRAAIDPDDPGLFDGLPDLDRHFGGVDGLLLALGYRWRNHLDVKIELGVAQGRTAEEMYRELCAE